MSSPFGAVYALLALVVLLAPFPARALRIRWSRERAFKGAFALILACAVSLTALRGDLILFVAATAALILFRKHLFVCGAIAGALLFAPVIWWGELDRLGLTAAALAGVSAALGVAAWLIERSPREGGREGPRKVLAPMLAAAAIGLLAGLPTAPFAQAFSSYTAWHHWGAYLAPAEAWLSGGAPYRDFPVQYGLGPTALLAATCGGDCWRSTYWVVVLCNALYFSALVGCAAILLRRSSRTLYWLGLAALFCATFVWTAFPAQLATTIVIPSVAGLRFLPLALLILHIQAAEAYGRRRDWLGHGLWLLCLFVSPEAAGFATLVWWPYLLLRDSSEPPSGLAVRSALIARVLQGAAFTVVGTALVTLCVWLVSDGGATAFDFFLYILHPPGPLPVNLLGPVWLFAMAIMLAVMLFWREEDTAAARRLYVLLLSLVAVGTYYVSRSHDNNLLNLLPFLVLLLLELARRAEAGASEADAFIATFVRAILAAVLVFIVAMNGSAWEEGLSRAGLWAGGPERMIARFYPAPGDDPALVQSDAAAALAYLREHNAGAVVLCDDKKVMPRGNPRSWWTGVNNPANFTSIPDEVVARYVERGARDYHQAGWLVVGPACRDRLFSKFQTAYHVADQRAFGSYRAYLMTPRTTGE